MNKYEGPKEINSSNTLMYINDEICEFEKAKIFDKSGEYIIKLKFNILLTDTQCMFSGCENITKIDLSSLVTKNIKNMTLMFTDCINFTIFI